VCFKDLLPGTQIYFTDNGYERVSAGLWGETEGVVSITRTTSTLAKGTIITISSTGTINNASDFTIYACGSADGNWTKSVVSNSFNLNKDDQVWFMQGGTWGEIDGDNEHNATYTGGNVLYGWTDIPWKTAPNYADSKGSTIYPSMTCFNTDVNNTVSGSSFVKFDDPDASGDFSSTTLNKLDWIKIINNTANWDFYADDAAYDAGGYNYQGSTTCPAMTISAGTYVDGKWTGETSTDWFDCKNWNTFIVPTSSVNVDIPNTGVTNEPTIGDPTTNTSAYCNDITIGSSRTLTMNHANSRFDVLGNIAINGQLNASNGVVNIIGGNTTFGNSGGLPNFYNLTLNKTTNTNTLTLTDNIDISNTITLTSGILTTGSDNVIVTNTAPASVTGHGVNSYIHGNLRRSVSATGSYDFPVGTADNYELANILLNSSSGIGYIEAKFTNPVGVTDISGLGLTVKTTLLTKLLDYGFWTITPDAAGTVDYKVSLTSRGHTNGGTLSGQHTIVKRANSSVNWASFTANHDNSTQSGDGANPIKAVLNGMTSFSDFAIARDESYFLPVELLTFDAELQKNSVLLQWVTATETNNEAFILEKSKDGYTFELFQQMMGSGQSNLPKSYNTVDTKPHKGTNYYKLLQRDFNGMVQDLGTRVVNYNSETNVFVFNSTLTIETKGIEPFKVYVYNTLGQKVKSYQLDNDLSLDLSELEKGVYLLKIESQGFEKVLKWVNL